MASRHEVVHLDLVAEIHRGSVGVGVQRRTCAVSDPRHHVEVGTHRHGIDQNVGSSDRQEFVTYRGQGPRLSFPHGFGQSDEQIAVSNSAITVPRAADGFKSHLIVLVEAAQTEQQRVTGRSVEAFVQFRRAGGDQFHLDPLQREPVRDHIAEYRPTLQVVRRREP